LPVLIFVAALVAIVVLALVVNRVTGTKAHLLETTELEPGEKELWRDSEADFATKPRLGGAVFMSFARMRRHTVVWTDRRIIVAQKVLLSSKRMITHQIVLSPDADSTDSDSSTAARTLGGGFYGRGFVTIALSTTSFGRVNDKDCVRIKPTEQSGAMTNIDEALIFTDRLAELQRSL
jgi:hypothetical protein